MENNLTWDEFGRVKMHVGTILEAKVFEKARKPAYILLIDFGPLGIKKSSAQITDHYTPETLPGRQIIAVLNFPSKQIANIQSECLVLGIPGSKGEVILLQPDQKAQNGDPVA